MKKSKKEWFDSDKAIGLFIIIILFVLIKTIVAPGTAKNSLAEEAEIVLQTLTDGFGEVSLLSYDEVLESKMDNLDRMDYEEIKNLIGIENDFCIYFEDITGNIVRIDDANLRIGSGKIYINGEPCE